MECDIIKDTAVLTTIPEKYIKKLIDKVMYCIADAAVDMRVSGSNCVDLNIGIGNLAIVLDNDEVHYKFIPSQELDNILHDAILNEQNLLEDALEAALVDKITNTYKDLI